MQLSVAVYLMMNAILHIIIGPISDRYGRRPVILVSIVLFLLATAGSILAPSVEVFLFCRTAQAIIVTGMVLSRAVVRDMVPQSAAASMIGYVTMGMAVAPMIGPAFGGFLDQLFGWKASFIFLMIIGMVTLTFTYMDLGETARFRPSSLKQQFSEYPELFRSRRFWGYCLVAAFASGAFLPIWAEHRSSELNITGCNLRNWGVISG